MNPTSGARVPYVQFCGGEGGGKTTQCKRLAQHYAEQPEGTQPVFTREPGGTPLGEHLRPLLVGDGVPMGELSRAMLFMLDKIETAEAIVRPALGAGRPVISDRCFVDTFVYNLPEPQVVLHELALWHAVGDFLELPTLVLLLAVEPSRGLARKAETDRNRYEEMGERKAKQIAEGYHRFFDQMREQWLGRPEFKGDPGFLKVVRGLGGTRFMVIDANRSEDDVFDEVQAVVTRHIDAFIEAREDGKRTQRSEETLATTG